MTSNTTRRMIRSKVKSILTNQTIAKNRVFSNRVRNLNDYEFPLLIVKTGVEDSEKLSDAPRILKRQLNITIEGHIEAEDRIDDRLDYFSEQIESAMHKDFTLGSMVSDSILCHSELSIFAEGDRLYGAIHLVYVATYNTLATPEQPLDDLEGHTVRLPGQ